MAKHEPGCHLELGVVVHLETYTNFSIQPISEGLVQLPGGTGIKIQHIDLLYDH
jgi:hypothetical protein